MSEKELRAALTKFRYQRWQWGMTPSLDELREVERLLAEPTGDLFVVCGIDGCDFAVEHGEGRTMALHKSEDHVATAVPEQVAGLDVAREQARERWRRQHPNESTDAFVAGWNAARVAEAKVRFNAAKPGLDAERIARAYQRYQYPTGPRRSTEEYRLIAEGIVEADAAIRAKEGAK